MVGARVAAPVLVCAILTLAQLGAAYPIYWYNQALGEVDFNPGCDEHPPSNRTFINDSNFPHGDVSTIER